MKNVILLAMSTLMTIGETFSVKETMFKYKNIDIDICRGQLEPVVKYMIMESDLENDDMKVIALCTKETTDISHKVVCKGKEGEEGEDVYSALSYFEDRINKFISEKKAGYRFECEAIPFDEQNPLPGIKKAISLIRQIYKDNGRDNVKFWIDTHGGFRDVSLITNAIISVLRMEDSKYEPDKIYGVKYGAKDEASEIVDQKYAFDIMKFVSGMEAFSRYGNADGLKEYFENDEHNNGKCDEIASDMNIISEGLQECNSEKYIKGLEKFKESINKIGDTDTSLLGIFKDYIVLDYEDLFEKGVDVTKNPIPIIKRCVDKKMYQQALTLIESLMPKYFIGNKVLFYDEIHNRKITKVKKKDKMKYLENGHYVFDSFIYVCKLRGEQDEDDILKDCFAECFNNVDSSFVDSDTNTKQITVGKNDSYKYEFNIETKVPTDKYVLAGKLMRMHKGIKKCRNLFNHSNPERPDNEYIEKVMREYIAITEEIIKSMEGKNNVY